MSFTIRTDRVRLTILLKRKPGMSNEEFSRYWAGEYGSLFASLEIVKTNILKYEQAHLNKEMRECFQGAGFKASEWDGMIVFEAESYAKIMEVLKNEDFQEIAMADAENFIDVPQCQFVPLDLITPIDKA
ncbi:hypothetical protein B0H11DRAFT_116613 [Mycena galericulata]|nr:hypothetical protein B0H11DRAFT_116613 [Mycena galericulata]